MGGQARHEMTDLGWLGPVITAFAAVIAIGLLLSLSGHGLPMRLRS